MMTLNSTIHVNDELPPGGNKSLARLSVGMMTLNSTIHVNDELLQAATRAWRGCRGDDDVKSTIHVNDELPPGGNKSLARLSVGMMTLNSTIHVNDELPPGGNKTLLATDSEKCFPSR